MLLNQEQTVRFITAWNKSKSEGRQTVKPEFWVILKLKNDSIRTFRTSKNLIKEVSDWTYSLSDETLISSFWQSDDSFKKPENYSPMSFIEKVSSVVKTNKNTLNIGIKMIDDFPTDWVKEEHIEQLMILLDSKKTCGCYLNPLSSYIPRDDFGEIGGYAAIFIQAFKENKKVQLGLYSCPKVDEELNVALRKWWREKK